MSGALNINVDATRFNRDFELYAEETSKTLVEAVNYKAYDLARESLKGTGKADKGKIADSLNERSKEYPARTVAEMLVIMKHWKTGAEIGDLKADAEGFVKNRQSHIAFVKSGLLPALRKLLPYVGKESVTVGGVVRDSFGGAEPAKKIGGNIVASIYNDVEGTGNKTLVEELKERGFQIGMDKVASSMETYLSKKLNIPIEKFNSTQA
jgi:hypothetical protein